MSLVPTINVPGTYVGVGATAVNRGPSIQPFMGLLMAQKLAAGTLAELTPTRVTSEGQVTALAGAGSQADLAAQAWFSQNPLFPLDLVLIDDAAGAVKASGTYTFAGTATAAGIVYAYLHGKRVTASVAVGDDANAVRAAVVAAIAADARLGVTALAGVADGVVDVTAKHGGEDGNAIRLSVNLQPGEFLPAGITVTIGQMTLGSLNPDVSEVWATIPANQYNVIVNPWVDQTNMDALDTELERRWGPLEETDGQAFSVKVDTHGNLLTYLTNHNSKHVVCWHEEALEAYPPAQAAASAAQIGQAASQQPNVSHGGRELIGIEPTTQATRFTRDERNQLITAGGATTRVSRNGRQQIERAVTMNTFNDATGSDDTSWRDVGTKFNLSYIKYDLKTRWDIDTQGALLAEDVETPASGTKVITPNSAKLILLGYFEDWAGLLLVQDRAQFERDLTAAIDVSDPTRLNINMVVKLVVGKEITAVDLNFQFSLRAAA